MKIYPTKQQATQAAIKEFGFLAVEMEVVNIVKVGPTIAKIYGAEEGYMVESND